MHPSIPAAPSPVPPGYCGAFARLFSSWGGAFANFVLLGSWAFDNPAAISGLLTRTRFPIRIYLHRGYYWKKSRLAHLSRTGVRHVLDFMHAFLHCRIKPELHGESWELLTGINVFRFLVNQISVDII